MMAKSIYIILSHTWKPSTKETHELAEFVDEIRERDHSDATTIIDFKNEKIIKDRDGKNSYKQFVWELVGKYPEQMNKLIEEHRRCK